MTEKRNKDTDLETGLRQDNALLRAALAVAHQRGIAECPPDVLRRLARIGREQGFPVEADQLLERAATKECSG
jgi:hypothetical protein